MSFCIGCSVANIEAVGDDIEQCVKSSCKPGQELTSMIEAVGEI